MKAYKIYQLENNSSTTIDCSKIDGYKVMPKNTFDYTFPIRSLILIKPNFTEEILKKKIKRKLDYYMTYLIELIDGTDGGSDSAKKALDEISRYKEIVEYKYRKYLDDKYINILQKKLSLLEYKIKSKTIETKNKKENPKKINLIENKSFDVDLEETHHRRR